MVVTNSGGIYKKKNDKEDVKFIDASLREKRGEDMDMAVSDLKEENKRLEEKLREKDAIIEKMAREKDYVKRIRK